MATMNRDRGQVIIVTSVAIAVLLISFSIIINGIVISGNGSSSEIDTSRVTDYFQVVINTSNNLVIKENKDTASLSGIKNGIKEIDSAMSEYNLNHGSWSSVKVTSSNSGSKVRQNDKRKFTNKMGDKNWTLVRDTPEARRFKITIDEASLYHYDTDDDTDKIEKNAFGIKIGENNVFIYTRESSNDIFLRIKQGGVLSSSCKFSTNSSSWAEFSISENNSCGELRRMDINQDEFNIEYIRGNNVSGLYTLSVPKGVRASNFAVSEMAGDPYRVQRTYSVTIQIKYFNDDLKLVDKRKIKPGGVING